MCWNTPGHHEPRLALRRSAARSACENAFDELKLQVVPRAVWKIRVWESESLRRTEETARCGPPATTFATFSRHAMDRFADTRSDVVNCSLAEAAARGALPMDVDQVAVIKGNGKKGKDGRGGDNGKRRCGKGQSEKGKEKREDERRYFYCGGKRHIKANCLPEGS